MFACCKTYRRSNYIAMRREIRYEKQLPELRETAEKNRDKAWEKKHRKYAKAAKTMYTQQDFLSKYFTMEAV